MVAIGRIVQKQAYVMAFSDTFFLLGAALIVALAASFMLRKLLISMQAAHTSDPSLTFASRFQRAFWRMLESQDR